MLKKRGIFLFVSFCFSLLPYLCFSAPTPKEWGKIMNLSGRQRMLSQKMAKEALLMYHKIDVDNQSNLLKETAALFERSLKGLRDGDEKIGLPPTTDENIKGQLDVVKSFWLVVKPLINKISNLGTTIITREEIITVTSVLDNLLKESNKAVSMYEKLTQ